MSIEVSSNELDDTSRVVYMPVLGICEIIGQDIAPIAELVLSEQV